MHNLIKSRNAVLIIFIIGVLAYLNSFRGEFVFDDWNLISSLKSWNSIADIWRFGYTRFVPNLTFYLNYKISLVNPYSYHLLNLLIHIINGILVFIFINLLTKNKTKYLSLLISLIFITHPVQTEAVTYITQRYTTMAAMFYLASLIFFILKLKTKNTWNYLLSIVFAVGAFLSKENAYSLPAILILVYWYFNKKTNFKNISLLLMPYVLFAFVFFILTFSRNNQINILAALSLAKHGSDISPTSYFLTQVIVVVTYLRLLILPINQNLDYDYKIVSSIFSLRWFLSFFILLSMMIFAYKLRKKYPLIFFGVVFFFITLSIESSFIPIKDVIFEHRLYLPLIGFALALFDYLKETLLFKTNQRIKILLATFIVMLLTLTTMIRNIVWNTEFTLWQDTVAKSPAKARPHFNLGVSYAYINDTENAAREFQKTIELDKSYTNAYINLGAIYESQKNYKYAFEYYLKAIKTDPQNQTAIKRFAELQKGIK